MIQSDFIFRNFSHWNTLDSKEINAYGTERNEFRFQKIIIIIKNRRNEQISKSLNHLTIMYYIIKIKKQYKKTESRTHFKRHAVTHKTLLITNGCVHFFFCSSNSNLNEFFFWHSLKKMHTHWFLAHSHNPTIKFFFFKFISQKYKK